MPHRPIKIADLKPGDIGFFYKDHDLIWKQCLINFGQTVLNVTTPSHRGDSLVMHSFLVVDVIPEKNKIWAADAAAGPEGKEGVGIIPYIFSADGTDDAIDVEACYLFYRFDDVTLRQRIVARARAWAQHNTPNFIMSHAVKAPWRSKGLHRRARARYRHLVTHDPTKKAVPGLNGGPYYRVMCSEFVASVCAPEIIARFCADKKLRDPTSRYALRGLKEGVAGDAFNCDPRWLIPSALQGRFSRSTGIKAVGYIPPVGV